MIQQSFLSLPLLLIGWSLFLGSLQGNIGLLVLFLGHLTVVPLTALFSNTLLEFLFKKLEGGSRNLLDYIQVDNSDICSLVPGKTDYGVPFLGVAPSLWMSHIVFFFSFPSSPFDSVTSSLRSLNLRSAPSIGTTTKS
jgi:hypothetical protein